MYDDDVMMESNGLLERQEHRKNRSLHQQLTRSTDFSTRLLESDRRHQVFKTNKLILRKLYISTNDETWHWMLSNDDVTIDRLTEGWPV